MLKNERYNSAFLRNELLVSIDSMPQPDKLMIAGALNLAEEIHATHFRLPTTDAEEPAKFIAHPLRVALMMIQEMHLCHPEPVCAAILHDIVEDSGNMITTYHLERRFGRNVAL